MARMLLVGSRRQRLGKTKQVNKNLLNLNWPDVGAPHTHGQISMGMGHSSISSSVGFKLRKRRVKTSMTWKSRLISAALAVGVLAAFALSAGADWWF